MRPTRYTRPPMPSALEQRGKRDEKGERLPVVYGARFAVSPVGARARRRRLAATATTCPWLHLSGYLHVELAAGRHLARLSVAAAWLLSPPVVSYAHRRLLRTRSRTTVADVVAVSTSGLSPPREISIARGRSTGWPDLPDRRDE